MLKPNFLKQHRAWEDVVVMALGLAIVLAPWVTRETISQSAMINAAVTGFALMMLAELDLVQFRRWVVIAQLAGGAWTTASAVVFGYAQAGALRFWHVLAGLGVILVGGLEIWQYRTKGTTTNRIDADRHN